MAIGDEIIFWNAKVLANRHDRLHFGFAGNFDIAFDGHFQISSDDKIVLNGKLHKFADLSSFSFALNDA